jgi:hypothetical protein
MPEKSSKSRTILGFKKNYINGIALCVALVMTIAFLWRVFIFRETMICFDLAKTLGLLVGVAGIALYLDRWPVTGMILYAIHILLVISTRIAYSMPVLPNVFMWIYICVLIVFMLVYFLRLKRPKHQ